MITYKKEPVKPELPAEMVDEEYLNFDELFGFENPWILLENVDKVNIFFLSVFMLVGIPANILIIIISARSNVKMAVTDSLILIKTFPQRK